MSYLIQGRVIKDINLYGIEENKQFLSELRDKIISESNSKELIIKASERNRTLDNKLIKGLIHGSRNCNAEQFSSIINYGLLCPEFTGGFEDGETFYHLDLFEIPSEISYQALIKNYPHLKSFLPWSNGAIRNKSIGFVIKQEGLNQVLVGKPSELQEYEFKDLINDKCIPMPYREGAPNHAAILGGVPSTSIVKIIARKEEAEWIIRILERKGLYIPVYNLRSEKIY